MLPVLTTAFKEAFCQPNDQNIGALPPLITFVMTISDFSALNIGAPFWGLIIGYLLHLILKSKKN